MNQEKLKEAMKLLNRQTYGFPSNKTLYDDEGRAIKIATIDNKLVPPFGEKHFKKIRDLPMRDDDIILCGYPKTGCHWTWEILSMIVNKKAEHHTIGKGALFMEMAPTELLEVCPSPRILNTHVWFDYLPKQIKEKKTKIVFTVRNPKDTAVSFYNHHLAMKAVYGYEGPFKSWFESFFINGKVDYGSYTDFHLDWDKAMAENPDQPILIVNYEDMKEDLPREIRKMSKHLGVSLDEQLIEEIAKAAGFDVMKQAYKENASISHSLLRKGQVGDWKNWLTVAMDEALDREIEKLAGTRFSKFRYTL